jgi:hypothetical protein
MILMAVQKKLCKPPLSGKIKMTMEVMVMAAANDRGIWNQRI